MSGPLTKFPHVIELQSLQQRNHRSGCECETTERSHGEVNDHFQRDFKRNRNERCAGQLCHVKEALCGLYTRMDASFHNLKKNEWEKSQFSIKKVYT